MDESLIFGRHPVLEALRAGRSVNRLYVLVGARGIPREVFQLAEKASVPVVRSDRHRLDRLAHGCNHQGLVAQLAAQDFVEVQEIIERVLASGEPPFLLALNGVQDPGNLGALLRTAEGAGVHGVILSSRNSCGLTATVSKTAAGADQFVPVARVERLERTLLEFSQGGLKTVGADGRAELAYTEADLSGGLILVLGSEGEGLEPRVARACETLVKVPMAGQVQSLNVSASGAVLLYEAVRQRQKLRG